MVAPHVWRLARGEKYAWVTYMNPLSANVLPDYAADFGDFEGRIWLNAAHQGPLPRVALAAAEEALAAKASPSRISDEAFVAVPQRLRELLGRLIGVSAEQIILGNSASWGLQVLANGLPWRARRASTLSRLLHRLIARSTCHRRR